MPRMSEITQREQVAEAERSHFDSIIASRGTIGAPYQYLLHTPDLAARVAHTIGYARFEAGLDKQVLELAICSVARELDCVYEWAAHEDAAREAGVREQAIESIKAGTAPDDLTPDEAVVVQYVHELLHSPHRASTATFGELHRRLGDRDMAELTAIVGGYVMLACCLNAFDVGAPAGRPVLPT
jgi:4-carboxymuconolactone decarboxylase